MYRASRGKKIARYIGKHDNKNYNLHDFILKLGIWGREKAPVNGGAR